MAYLARLDLQSTRRVDTQDRVSSGELDSPGTRNILIRYVHEVVY